MAQFGGSQLVKQIHFDEGRDKLITGINKLAEAVGSTLGASGRTVVIEDDFGNAHVTKDGVTVAEAVHLHDPVENLGSTMMKSAAKQTASKAGDGTTTSTVLAQAIIKEFQENKGDHSFRDVKAGIDKFTEKALKTLDSKSVKVDDKRLKSVSIISANNDKELGSLIADAFIAAGDNGVVTMETSKTGETYVDVVNGTQIDSTFSAPHFMTDNDKEICELDNPLIFLSTTEIPNTRKIQDILEHAIKSNRSILLIAPLAQQPIQALAMNKVKGNFKVSVAEPPSYGVKRKDLLDDLALLVGATVFDDSLGDSLDAITIDMLGSADKVIQDKDGTVIVVENKPQVVDDKVKDLNVLMEEAKEVYLINHLQKRLALLCGGVSRIYVGADTDVELKEKQDRVDDAIHAVRAAKKEGILPGGGAALKYIGANCDVNVVGAGELTGWQIMAASVQTPFNRILSNGSLVNEGYDSLKWGQGVDATDGKVKDMRKAGIIDPTLVTKEALKNAVSVAVTILSTDAVISNVRE